MEPGDRGWSRAAEPGGRGWSPEAGGGALGPRVEPCRGALGLGPRLEPAARARTGALKHVSAGIAPPPPLPGHQGPLCVYNLQPGNSAGPSRAGRCRDQKGLCCTGWGGKACFSGRVWVYSRDARLAPNRPAPGLPLPGAVWTLGRFQPYFLPRCGPLFSRRHFPNSRHYYFTQVNPVLARSTSKKPGGASED